MRLLITGVGGFLGAALAKQAHELGHEVCGLDRAVQDPVVHSLLTGLVEKPVTLQAALEAIERFAPDACVHFAGRASVPESVLDPLGDFEAATLPTVAMLEAIRRGAPRCRFILASSAAVYGAPEMLPIAESQATKPVSPYGVHKLICESLCREFHEFYGLETASVRIFSAYGEGLRRQVVWDICERIALGGALTLQGVPEASRDFIHASDVASGILLVIENGRLKAETYNLASGEETRVGELAERLCVARGVQLPINFDGNIPAGTPVRWQANLTKIRALGFSPRVSLDEGLQAFTTWWQSERSTKAWA